MALPHREKFSRRLLFLGRICDPHQDLTRSAPAAVLDSHQPIASRCTYPAPCPAPGTDRPVNYQSLASVYLEQWIGQHSQDPQTLKQAATEIQQAVSLSDSTFWFHGVLSQMKLWQKQYAEARAAAERAMALSDDAMSQTFLGTILNCEGRSDETLELMQQVTCSTSLIRPASCFLVLGNAYSLLGRYEEAIGAFQDAFAHKPQSVIRLLSHLGLTISYSELGRTEEARAEIAEVLKLNPQFSLEVWQQRVPYQDPAVIDRIASALRKAGLE